MNCKLFVIKHIPLFPSFAVAASSVPFARPIINFPSMNNMGWQLLNPSKHALNAMKTLLKHFVFWLDSNETTLPSNTKYIRKTVSKKEIQCTFYQKTLNSSISYLRSYVLLHHNTVEVGCKSYRSFQTSVTWQLGNSAKLSNMGGVARC